MRFISAAPKDKNSKPNFLRRRMDRRRVDKHFSAAVKEAMKRPSEG
jgi:hypothetical protein